MAEELYEYPGKELELFALANNWKTYWSSQVLPYVAGRILEVGGGKGENIGYLLNDKVKEWLSVEPDGPLFAALQLKIASSFGDGRVRGQQSTINEVPVGDGWDTLLYIDVLEHIEHDQAELALAASKLCSGGTVIVLSPAHQWLFSKFDGAIGHWRRYDRAMIERLRAPGCKLERVIYLDSVGMLASLANRLMLRQSYPNESQIRLWDQRIVPVSRWLDPLFGFRLGKTIVAIWRKE